MRTLAVLGLLTLGTACFWWLGGWWAATLPLVSAASWVAGQRTDRRARRRGSTRGEALDLPFLMAADDLTVALDLAIVAVASRTPADEIVILTPEAGSGDLRPRAALRRLPQAQLDLDADLHGWSAADGVPLLESRPAPLEGPLGDVLPGCRSALLVPLRTVEAVVGLIALGCQDAHAFDEEDLSTVESLARPLGFAIQRFMDTGAHSQGRTRVREMATPASRPGQRRAA